MVAEGDEATGGGAYLAESDSDAVCSLVTEGNGVAGGGVYLT